MERVAIFDLDGTLLNTIADLGEACNYALQEFGYPLHKAEEYPHLVGNGVNRLIERALPEGEKTEENVLKLRKVFVEYYNLHNKVHTRPYEGITEVLELLKKDGWKLAVASNKYQAATEDLVKHYFPNVFDVIFGEREGCPRKPDPQIVRDILRSLDAGEDLMQEREMQVVYIGDSDVDMQTAKNAGKKVIACSWGFCSKEILNKYNPDWLIDSPRELYETLTQEI